MTQMSAYESHINKISIHTPGKGVTMELDPTFDESNFNPHTREGCDSKLFIEQLDF